MIEILNNKIKVRNKKIIKAGILEIRKKCKKRRYINGVNKILKSWHF
jgi:hypothetical protein